MNNLYIIAAISPWLAILCYYDCKYRKLPNLLTISMILLALTVRFGIGDWQFAMSGLMGGFMCGLFLLLPFLLRGAGAGDVKMITAVGCIIGFGRVLDYLILLSISGFALMIIMLLFGFADAKRLKHLFRSLFDWRYDKKEGKKTLPKKDNEKSRIPFGVAIAMATWAILLMAYIYKI